MAVDVLMTTFVQRGAPQLSATFNSLARDANRTETAFTRMNRIGGGIAVGSAMAGAALLKLGKDSLQAAGEVQRVETGFQTVLKDARKVQELSKGVRDFDIKTPFSYLETAKASQMLLASGFRQGGKDGQDLLQVLDAVGNAVVAAGGGTEKFIRSLAIMGKIKTSGVLTGVRVNQFAAAGINIKDILKKELGLSDGDMMNIGKLKLKADIVIPALIKGMDKQFAGGIDRAAKGYLGSLETLQGSQDKLKASIGKSIIGDVTGVIKQITGLTDAVERFTATHPRITKTVLAMAAIGVTGGVIYGAVTAFRMAAMSKKLLEKATLADDKVEKMKTITAAAEGVSLAKLGDTATKTAGKVSFLQKVQAAGARQIGTMVGGRALTAAGAGAGLALGAAAGYGAFDDRRALGDNNAKAKGVATGVAAAAGAMFLPGAAVPIAIATGFRYVFNQLVNKPMEARAEKGDGIDGLGKMSHRQRYEAYVKDYEAKFAAGDETGAALASASAKAEFRLAEREDARRRSYVAPPKAGSTSAPQLGQVSNERNGDRTVLFRIPEDRAGRAQRKTEYALRTASPNYAENFRVLESCL